jgi:hypothetical protein
VSKYITKQQMKALPSVPKGTGAEEKETKKKGKKKRAAPEAKIQPHRPVVMLPFGRFETTSSSIEKSFDII